MTADGPLIVSNCTLGLGYGMGWNKFAQTMLAGAMGGPPVQFTQKDADSMMVNVSAFAARHGDAARAMPSRLSETDRVVHCAVAAHVVDVYRRGHPQIVAFWKACEEFLGMMTRQPEGVITDVGPIQIVRGGIVLPSGLTLKYPELHYSDESESYVYKNRFGFTKLYGGLVCENITQALARVVVSDQIHAMTKKGYKVATTTHDEVLLVVPDGHAQQALDFALQTMKTAPEWAEGLPLNAEGSHAKCYGDAK